MIDAVWPSPSWLPAKPRVTGWAIWRSTRPRFFGGLGGEHALGWCRSLRCGQRSRIEWVGAIVCHPITHSPCHPSRGAAARFLGLRFRVARTAGLRCACPAPAAAAPFLELECFLVRHWVLRHSAFSVAPRFHGRCRGVPSWHPAGSFPPPSMAAVACGRSRIFPYWSVMVSLADSSNGARDSPPTVPPQLDTGLAKHVARRGGVGLDAVLVLRRLTIPQR